MLALSTAVGYGNLEMVNALLDAGVDPNTYTHEHEDEYKIVEALLTAGVDINNKK
jgi:ankyrin repeat protein